MKLKTFTIPAIFILFLITISFAQAESIAKDKIQVCSGKDTGLNFKSHNASGLEIPKITVKDDVITHFAFTLSYNEEHEQANWITYELTEEETNARYKRTDKFIPDSSVKTGTANDTDYRGSGYDRGHLAPAGDMAWSSTALMESFYYCNISPQVPSFNRGIWKKLEALVRKWAKEEKLVFVVTGPVLENNLPTIGPDKVSVPRYFYKVILDYREPVIKGIGFVIPNKASSEPLQNYSVTINRVENLTGIDFFPSLPDDQEEAIESTLNLNIWNFDNINSNYKNLNEKPERSVTSIQCKCITKKGDRCKNRTKNTCGYCDLYKNKLIINNINRCHE